MNNEILNKYKIWQNKVTDKILQDDLNNLTDSQIEDRFFKDLTFGTGGLRGIIGAGSNCLNIYTIRKATKGISNYLVSIKAKSVVICYDSRINSDLFAKTSAEVFASDNIKVYLSKELMPTPFTSFAVRHLGADLGVMITASHNPAIYNGYKVYGNDGCQITDNSASIMSNEMSRVDCFEVKTDSFENYLNLGIVEYINDTVEDVYLSKVKTLNFNNIEDISVTYSALNGTGYRIIPKLLNELGVELDLVKEQCFPDGNFPTCKSPNPEKKEALALGIEYCKKNKSDLLIATDPDADRVGIAVKTDDDYKLLSGNEVGVLLTDYVLSQKKLNGTLEKNSIIAKTIVTTDLVFYVAKLYGAKVVDLLTGFKYIGELIGELEKTGESDKFVLGFEESYGYLAGTFVRDKDAVIACQLIVEMASYYKKQGLSLAEKLEELYKQFGYFENHLYNYEFHGKDGFDKMADIMNNLRLNSPKLMADKEVIGFMDYENQSILPKSNVLEYKLEGGIKVTIRPSGTEPKLKIYLSLSGSIKQNKWDEVCLSDYFKTIME